MLLNYKLYNSNEIPKEKLYIHYMKHSNSNRNDNVIIHKENPYEITNAKNLTRKKRKMSANLSFI